MLQAIGLTKRYEDGLLALDHLDLTVHDGELFCLLGANGAGGPGVEDARLDLSTMPQYRPRNEPFLSALGRATPDLVILGLWSAVMLMLAFWRFLRYDVR